MSEAGGAVRIALRVHPRARRARLKGTLGDVLKVDVAAPPESGAANQAVIDLIADALDVPRAAVGLVSGPSSRSKTIEVSGLDAATVSTRLAAAL